MSTTDQAPPTTRPLFCPENIPQELKDIPQWVCWRMEHRADSKGELKPTKVPINAATGNLAAVDTPSTWTTFQDALDAYEHDGIGFVFVDGGGYAGVDLDGCRNPDTGEIAPWAMRWVKRLPTYWEVSPSRTGLKGFCRGSLAAGDWKSKTLKDLPNQNGKPPKIEKYSSGRFFTVTGAHLEGTPLVLSDCSEALHELQEHFAPKAEPARNGNRPPITLSLDDAELLDKARRAANGPKFERLFDLGDTGQYGGDESSADLALCDLLAFWCQGDAAQIDRLFRQSALFRDKWGEARGDRTYGERTIDVAIGGCREFYRPGAARSSQDGPNGKGHYDEPPSPPEAPDEAPPAEIGPEDRYRTDMGNSRRLVRRHGKNLRYVGPWDTWLAWDGRRWAWDLKGQVMERAKDTTRSILREAAAITDESKREEFVRFAFTSQSAPRLEAMVRLARTEPELAALPEQFDVDPWLFNCANGTIELPSGQLRKHRREDMITRMSPVNYDANARLDAWDNFLHELTGGSEEFARFLQKGVGHSLTGDTSEEVVFLGLGPTGTGKSTFFGAVKAALGGYAETADFETFLARKEVGRPRPDLARLAGARFVSSIETEEGKRLAEGLIKWASGGDPMVARFLFSKEFSFQPCFKLWLAANDAPKVRHDDDAIWRRLLRLPFVHKPVKTDKKLKNLLHDPKKAGPAILAWAVAGCLAWQSEGLGVPPVVEAATRQYREEMDPLRDFLEECCIVRADCESRASQLWEAYQRWAKDNSVRRPLSQRTLGENLRKHGGEPFLNQRGGLWRAWRGIGLVVETDDPTGTNNTHHTDQRADFPKS